MNVRSLGRVDAVVTVVLATCALALYIASLPPSFAFWDTGELQTVAAILGIAHPPACPAFVLLGWTFAHVLPFGDPAWRVNAMCATATALAVGLLFATLRLVPVSRAVAIVVTIGFATASVPWRDATRAEVQDLELLWRALALFFAMRWHAYGRARDLFLVGLAVGLAGATHGVALLVLPALAPLVFGRRSQRPFGTYAACVGGVALGLLPFAYLPVRAAVVDAAGLDPTVALGLPAGLPFWNYDDPRTWHNFVRVVTGADFDVHSGFAGFADLGSYPRYGIALVRNVVRAYGFVGAVLAALGFGFLIARKRTVGLALALATLLPVPYTEAYNELQDPARYYVLALWCAAIAIGIAFDEIVALAGFAARGVGRIVVAGALVASIAAAEPDRPNLFAQRSDRSAPRYVDDVVASTPSNAIVVAEWAYATPLAYAAYVQRRLGDRTIVSAAPLQFARWYRRWIRTRPVYLISFDDALQVPGFVVDRVFAGYYYEYRLER